MNVVFQAHSNNLILFPKMNEINTTTSLLKSQNNKGYTCYFCGMEVIAICTCRT